MSFSTIFAGIVSIAQAIPAFMDLLEKFHAYWIDYKISQVREDFNQRQIKEKALYESIKKADDDKTRIALSIILSDINKLP